jgi:hypothetical protein
MRLSSISGWVYRGWLSTLLIAVYFFAWSPVRSLIVTDLASPLLQEAARVQEEDFVDVNPTSGAVLITLETIDHHGSFGAPAGVTFLLPGLFLVLFSPVRTGWLIVFWIGHCGISGLCLLGWFVALTGLMPGAYVAEFVNAYLVDAYSLLAPVIAVVGSSIPVGARL